jgi:hypothetical protein
MVLAFVFGKIFLPPKKTGAKLLYKGSLIRYMIKVNSKNANSERRLVFERRRFQYSQHIPERRSDRREKTAIPWLQSANVREKVPD